MEKYKVILVDDEIEAIQAMEHKMDWDGLGFEVSGSATNGAVSYTHLTLPTTSRV